MENEVYLENKPEMANLFHVHALTRPFRRVRLQIAPQTNGLAPSNTQILATIMRKILSVSCIKLKGLPGLMKTSAPNIIFCAERPIDFLPIFVTTDKKSRTTGANQVSWGVNMISGLGAFDSAVNNKSNRS